MLLSKNMPRVNDDSASNTFDDIRRTLATQGVVSLSLSAHPSRPTTRIQGVMADGTLKIDVAAVPEQGKANDEIVRFFKKQIGVAGLSFSLKGGISRKKTLIVARDS